MSARPRVVRNASRPAPPRPPPGWKDPSSCAPERPRRGWVERRPARTRAARTERGEESVPGNPFIFRFCGAARGRGRRGGVREKATKRRDRTAQRTPPPPPVHRSSSTAARLVRVLVVAVGHAVIEQVGQRVEELGDLGLGRVGARPRRVGRDVRRLDVELDRRDLARAREGRRRQSARRVCVDERELSSRTTTTHTEAAESPPPIAALPKKVDKVRKREGAITAAARADDQPAPRRRRPRPRRRPPS